MKSLNTMLACLSLLLCLPAAHALKLNQKLPNGWRANDLTKLSPQMRLFLHGASASIVPNKGDAIPTVLVFQSKFSGSKNPGASVDQWKKFVRSLNPKIKVVFVHAHAYKTKGQSRFYTEVLSDSDLGSQTETAFLFVLHGNDLMTFSYDGTGKEFQSNLTKVKGLYRALQVDN